jgi:hypothetical protein
VTKVTPRECNLLLTGAQKLALYLPLIMFLALPFIFWVIFTQHFGNQIAVDVPAFFPWFPLLLFPFLGLYFAWRVLSLPNRITSTPEQTLVFKSLLSSRVVRVVDIQSIEPGRLGIQAPISGFVLKHRDGKLVFTAQFTGFYELLHEIKLANPSIDIKGF